MARAVTIAIYKKVSLTFLIRHGTPSKRTSRPRVHAVKDTALAHKAREYVYILKGRQRRK